MQLRSLPCSDKKISVIGFGGMSFSDFYGAVTEQDAIAVLDAGIAAGITHIDTANVYGNGKSETIIGNYLNAHPGLRDRIVLATKAGIARRPNSVERDFRNDYDHLRSELEKSLERLQTDHVDIFYLHRRDQRVTIETAMDSLCRFKEEGLIGGIGLSEIAPTTLELASKIAQVTAVQSEYSLATRSPELGLLQRCKQLETLFVAFSPVGRGLLTDRQKTADEVLELPWLRTNPRFQTPNLERNIEATQAFRDYAHALEMTTAQLAVNWVISKSQHIVTIPGTRSDHHLISHIKAGQTTLDAKVIARCEDLLPVGWAHGDRYSEANWRGPERFC